MAKDVSKKLEVRTSWKARAAGTALGWLVRILSWTLRMKVEDRCGLTDPERHRTPLIWCCWHSRIVAMAMARKRVYPWRKGVVLTSASHDGAALAAAAKVIGVGSVRGSSSRRGSAAMKELIRAVRSGVDVGVTPDGPRGPRYRIHSGIVKLAQMTRVPVMGFHVHYTCALRLKTWDRFVIPLPFSKLTIIFDELLAVPRELDDDAFEAKRLELESLMRAGVDDLDLPAHEHSRRKKSRR